MSIKQRLSWIVDPSFWKYIAPGIVLLVIVISIEAFWS